MDIDRQNLQTKLKIGHLLGGESNARKTLLEATQIVALLVLRFRSYNKSTAIVQHLGRYVERGHVEFDVAHPSVAGTESGQYLQETQYLGHPVVLEDVTTGNEHRLAKIVEHIQNVQRVAQAVLVVIDNQHRLPLGGDVFPVDNMHLSIIQMIMKEFQIMIIAKVTPGEISDMREINHKIC